LAFQRILNFYVVSCVQFLCSSTFYTANRGCPPAQQHTFSFGLLFDETFAHPDIYAVVNCHVLALSVFYSSSFTCSVIFFVFLNCADVALSVFYSTERVAGYFCSFELLCLSVECCVLLQSPNLER